MRTRVIQAKTGKPLGYCDVTWRGGRCHYVTAVNVNAWPIIRYRWRFLRYDGVKIQGVALVYDVYPPELVARGMRDARLLPGFNSMDDLFLSHTIGAMRPYNERPI